MKQSDIDKIIQAVETQIKVTVNHKIEKLHERLDKHIEDYKPIMEVYSTATNIGRFTKWISGVLLAAALLYTYIKGWII